MLRSFLISGALGAAALFSSALAGDDPRQGEQVRSICFARSIDNFRTIKGEDDVVLLEKGVNDWYRVELSGACGYRHLRFAQAISIDSRPSGGCVRRGDILVFHDSAFGGRDRFKRRCFISDIYEWDPDALNDEDDDDDQDADD